jgi:quinol monooxygenase YgiN
LRYGAIQRTRVRPGKEEEFLAAWRKLADTFSSLPSPAYWGTLIRSTTQPRLFHSFGPWKSTHDVKAMRGNPEASAAFKSISECCEEMMPGDYEEVIHVRVRDEPPD